MSLSDPQLVTIAGVALSLPRVSSGINSGTYTTNDGNHKLTVSHQNGKRERHFVRLDISKIAPDPLISAQNIKYGASIYLVIDEPVTGFTTTELKDAATGFMAALTASSGALLTKFIGGEN